ncbi:MAG TPA: hypothetical protein VMU39_23580 [Solirubrobacteraceae bacterium]|nr:hypothetical protein [Solirubrobacteraceae bacterium]
MSERCAVWAVTGDDVVRFTLEDGMAGEAEVLLTGAGAKCLAVDPRAHDRVYVGTFDDGLYTTADGGASWREPLGGLDETRVLSVAVSPSHVENGVSVAYAGTEPSNLYRSEDGGERWTRLVALRELPSEPRWSFPPRPWTHHVRTIALHPTDPAWIAVGIELGGVMRSFDGGAAWHDHNPQAHSDAHELLTHPLATARLYEAAGQGIARSDDLGETWTALDGGLDRRYAWALAVDPADPDLWYVSVSRSPFAAHSDGDGQARLLRSRGDGWTAVDTWGDDPALRRMPYALCTLPGQPRRLLAGLRGGTLLLTDDAGESWSRLTLILPDIVALVAVPQ